MIYARSSQRPLVGKGWTDALTYKLDPGVVAYKLTLNVRAEEDVNFNLLQGPVIVEITEDPHYVFEETAYTEQYCELGFWSKSFATPITGWRIKVPEGAVLPGLVDMVAYG